MLLGCCTSATANTAFLATSTLDYIEENVQAFLVPLQHDAVFAAHLEAAQAAGKPLGAACCFLPGNLPCVGPSVDRSAVLNYAAVAFHRAAQAGIQRIVFGSGGSRRIPEGWAPERAREQFTTLLGELAPLARRNHLQVVVEPLNPGECNFITTVREGAAIVRDVADPSIRLLADLYHMVRAGETAADLAAVTDLLAHVHIAEHAERTAPGVAGDDFRPFLAVLRQAGYDQRISLECGKFDLVTELEAGLATVRQQWQGSVKHAAVAAF
jgi:sugar phosphate isomerase/epimerase